MPFRFTWGLLPPAYETYVQRTFLPNPFRLTLKITIKNNNPTSKWYKIVFSNPNLTTNPYIYDFGGVGSGQSATKDITLEFVRPAEDADYPITIRVEQYSDSEYTQLDEVDERPFMLHVYDIIGRRDFVKLYKVYFRDGFNYTNRLLLIDTYNGSVSIHREKYASYPVSYFGHAWNRSFWTHASVRVYIPKAELYIFPYFVNASVAGNYNGDSYADRGRIFVLYRHPAIMDQQWFLMEWSGAAIINTPFYQVVGHGRISDDALILFDANSYSSDTVIFVDDVIIFTPKSLLTNRFRQHRFSSYKDHSTTERPAIPNYSMDYHKELGLILTQHDLVTSVAIHLLDPYENSFRDVTSGFTSPDKQHEVVSFKNIGGDRGWLVLPYNRSTIYFYNYDTASWTTISLLEALPSKFQPLWRGEPDVIYAVYDDGRLVKITVSAGTVETIANTGDNDLKCIGYNPDTDVLYMVFEGSTYKYNFRTGESSTLEFTFSPKTPRLAYLNNKLIGFEPYQDETGAWKIKIHMIDTTTDTYTTDEDPAPDLGTVGSLTYNNLDVRSIYAPEDNFIFSCFYTWVYDEAGARYYTKALEYIYYVP